MAGGAGLAHLHKQAVAVAIHPQIHQFLAVCREPFIEALKLEPLLLEATDPAGSVTARRYCAFITEGVQAGCMATSDQFCFLPRCQELRESLQP